MGYGGSNMKIFSRDFQNGGKIPTIFTCDGDDISPHVGWDDVPVGVKSYALIVDDPDAPMGTWVHWLVGNIPPSVREIPQNTLPPNAIQVPNDFGKPNYGGPCPPGGTHRYFFKLYALNVDSMKGVKDKKAFYKFCEKHKMGEAVLMGHYTRR
jgi:Raf kinase inhibitor-like YbhB/YbcL family protein